MNDFRKKKKSRARAYDKRLRTRRRRPKRFLYIRAVLLTQPRKRFLKREGHDDLRPRPVGDATLGSSTRRLGFGNGKTCTRCVCERPFIIKQK